MKETFAKGIFALATNHKVDWSKEKIVSHGQLSTYSKCPRSWELKHVRGNKVFDPSIDLIFGQAMHTVMQSWLKTMYTTTIKAANAMDLEGMLMEEMKKEYVMTLQKEGTLHYTNQEEMAEYYVSGCEIIKTLRSKRKLYFETKDVELIAIELPLNCSPDPTRPNVILQGYLDLIFYDKASAKYKIIDIKTSKKGWSQWAKKDKTKANQVVLYKKYFCELYDLPYDRVDVEYFIVKRKIDLDSLYPQKRIQVFAPSNGKLTIKKLEKEFLDFLRTCFNEDGTYIDRKHPAIAGENYYNCRFCVFNENEELCPKSDRITKI